MYCSFCCGDLVLDDGLPGEGKCDSCGAEGECFPIEVLLDALQMRLEQNVILCQISSLDYEHAIRMRLDEVSLADVIDAEIPTSADMLRSIMLQSFEDKNGVLFSAFLKRRLGSLLWKEFVIECHSRGRYYSALTTKILDTAMKVFAKFYTVGDVVTEYSGAMYRARAVGSIAELQSVLSYPGANLGAPPPGLAASGRLNANGVPVFYGASSRSAAMAELRAPVGGLAVVASFQANKNLSLLDLRKFYKLTKSFIEKNGGLSSPDAYDEKEALGFIQHFLMLMRVPLVPNQDPRAYLETQIISEYLSSSHWFDIDGIIYQSVQNSNDNNIALFNKASRSSQATLSLTSDPCYVPLKNSVFAVRPSDKIPVFPKRDEHTVQGVVSQYYTEGDNRPELINIDPNSIQLFYVDKVDFQTVHLPLIRSLVSGESPQTTA